MMLEEDKGLGEPLNTGDSESDKSIAACQGERRRKRRKSRNRGVTNKNDAQQKNCCLSPELTEVAYDYRSPLHARKPTLGRKGRHNKPARRENIDEFEEGGKNQPTDELKAKTKSKASEERKESERKSDT